MSKTNPSRRRVSKPGGTNLSWSGRRMLADSNLVNESRTAETQLYRVSAADKPLHQITPSPEGNVEGKIRINKGWLCVPHHFWPTVVQHDSWASYRQTKK
jgi:hypothetical protein